MQRETYKKYRSFCLSFSGRLCFGLFQLFMGISNGLEVLEVVCEGLSRFG